MTKGSDNVFPRFLISEGGSTATPAAGRVTVYAKANGLLYSKDDAGFETLMSGVGSGVTAQENFLTSDVTMTSANTFYDGPSLSLAAGTYVLMGVITILTTATGHGTAKLWDGTTVYGSVPEHFGSTAGGQVAIPVVGYAVLGGTTTLKISAAMSSAGNTLKRTGAANGTTNKASHLVAVKIA